MKRLVMARTADGKTISRTDEDLPRAFRPPGMSGIELTGLWAADSIPQLPIAPEHPAVDVSVLPAAGATSFRLVGMEAGSVMNMHSTDTVDYLMILSGCVTIEPEGGAEIALCAGDFVVQLGGRHAWHNRGTVACLFAAVIVGAISEKARQE